MAIDNGCNDCKKLRSMLSASYRENQEVLKDNIKLNILLKRNEIDSKTIKDINLEDEEIKNFYQ